MQRLNNYLLTRYPLLWNLRVHFVWPAILLLNALFWITGYASISLPGSLNWYALRVQGGTISMGVLCAMLAGVLWLVFYLRNNAFKRFYPLRRGHLVTEALLILITCFGLTTFIPAYESGVYVHIRSLTARTDVVGEANITNLAHHFIPFSRAAFASSGDCTYSGEHVSNHGHPHDIEDTARATEAVRPVVDTFSYLHYCNDDVSVYDVHGIRTERGNDSIAKHWLIGGRHDSVRLILKEYLSIAKKYGARYRFDPEAQTREIFAEPGFPVRQEVNRFLDGGYLRAVEDGQVATDLPDIFIEDQRVLDAISATAEARKGWLDTGTALLVLYLSLGTALAVFSFRITSLRPWIIALIGTNIWGAIFGVLAATVGRFGSGYELTVISIILSLTFVIAAYILVREKRAKRNAGVLYLWGLWSLPAIIPLLAAWVEHLTMPANRYDARTGMMAYEPAPLHDWIHSNWPLIGFGNIVLFLLLLIILFIPLARKWQAMPEE